MQKFDLQSIDGVKKHQHFLNIYKAMEPEQRSLLKDIASEIWFVFVNNFTTHIK